MRKLIVVGLATLLLLISVVGVASAQREGSVTLGVMTAVRIAR
ncbi:MAG TPA: hypothetical protein VGK74_13855 [Symbiobacteriaceae bacterium]|jgi:hypothetical protein